MVRPDAAVELGRRAQNGVRGDEGVAADGDGDGGRLRGGGGGGGRGGGGLGGVVLLLLRGADQVPPDAGVGLDYGASAEDYVLGAVDEGAAGDFVAGVLRWGG